MKKLQLTGSATERGHRHGELMREEIHRVLDYYRSRFLTDRAKLQNHVDLLMQRLMAFRPEYRVEWMP